MDSTGARMGYLWVIDGFYVGTSRLSMGLKWASTRLSMGLSVGTNRTRMGYQRTLTVHRCFICVLSMGFMWVLADYRWVLSAH